MSPRTHLFTVQLLHASSRKQPLFFKTPLQKKIPFSQLYTNWFKQNKSQNNQAKDQTQTVKSRLRNPSLNASRLDVKVQVKSCRSACPRYLKTCRPKPPTTTHLMASCPGTRHLTDPQSLEPTNPFHAPNESNVSQTILNVSRPATPEHETKTTQ